MCPPASPPSLAVASLPRSRSWPTPAAASHCAPPAALPVHAASCPPMGDWRGGGSPQRTPQGTCWHLPGCVPLGPGRCVAGSLCTLRAPHLRAPSRPPPARCLPPSRPALLVDPGLTLRVKSGCDGNQAAMGIRLRWESGCDGNQAAMGIRLRWDGIGSGAPMQSPSVVAGWGCSGRQAVVGAPSQPTCVCNQDRVPPLL